MGEPRTRRKPDPDGLNCPDAVRMDRHELELARTRYEAWVLLHKVKPCTDDSPRCLLKLTSPRHRCSKRCRSKPWPWVLDHPMWFRGPQGEYVLTCASYGMGEADRETLAAIELCTGATLTIDAQWGGWYWPTRRMMMITLWGKP